MSQYPHPSNKHTVSLDPAAPGTPLRYALVLEAFFNGIAAACMTFAPYATLEYLADTPDLVTPFSATVLQIIAALFLSLAVPLLMAVPNTRRGIELRAPVYIFLSVTEVCLIVGVLRIALTKQIEESGIKQATLLTFAGNMVPPLAWRAYVLGVRPEWIGRYRDGGVEKIE